MAQRVVHQLTDDLSGVSSADDPTVARRVFSLGDQHYEAEFSDTSWKLLTEALAPFADVARTRGRATPPVSRVIKPRRTAASRDRSREIRTWARANGHKVQDRGRIKAEVVHEWEKATNS